MNVEIGTEAPIFLSWEYLFQIFGILSLQCMENHVYNKIFSFCLAVLCALGLKFAKSAYMTFKKNYKFIMGITKRRI
jgi:hypothetical protein